MITLALKHTVYDLCFPGTLYLGKFGTKLTNQKSLIFLGKQETQYLEKHVITTLKPQKIAFFQIFSAAVETLQQSTLLIQGNYQRLCMYQPLCFSNCTFLKKTGSIFESILKVRWISIANLSILGLRKGG